MKKLTAILLALVMLLTLAACGDNKDSSAGIQKNSSAGNVATTPEDIATLYMKAYVNGDFATTEKYLLYDPETVAMERMTSLDKDMDYFYQIASEAVATNVTNWSELQKAAQELIHIQTKAEAGGDYTIAINYESSKALTLEELSSGYAAQLEYVQRHGNVDIASITEVQLVTITGKLSTAKGVTTDTIDVVLVKYQGSWKVLEPDYSIISNIVN